MKTNKRIGEVDAARNAERCQKMAMPVVGLSSIRRMTICQRRPANIIRKKAVNPGACRRGQLYASSQTVTTIEASRNRR